MNLRCPQCCSELADDGDRARGLTCPNCGATCGRGEAFVTIADAETALCPSPEPDMFCLCRTLAVGQLTHPDGAISAASPHSDPDELSDLAEDALCAGIVSRRSPRAFFAVYPASLSAPEPLLAVNPGEGPALLGFQRPLPVPDAAGDPLSFTVDVLARMVREANALLRAADRALCPAASDPPRPA